MTSGVFIQLKVKCVALKLNGEKKLENKKDMELSRDKREMLKWKRKVKR